MARSIVLGNGELAVALDDRGLVRDIYYPHVGLEDHVRGHYLHRIGVWVDGAMSWFDEDPAWKIRIGCEDGALASNITASNPAIGIELSLIDVVHNEQPVFFRRVKVTNLSKQKREIKLYFGQQFEIYKAHGGDTGYYDPASHSLIHYKGRRAFQIRAELEGELFSDYAVGVANFHGKEGAWRDADDGALSKNPIEHGLVDSVLGLYGNYAQGESKLCHYWIVAERSIALAQEQNEYITRKSPEYLIQAALSHWKTWSNTHEPDFAALAPAQRSLYTQSLLHTRAHVDQGGGVIASLDSDMLQYGLDTYSYVWPRDAAYVVLALDRAGDTAPAKRLFEFCASAISHDGYLMHKYLPDGSLGSSWHPWIRDGALQLPIQEDETALVIYALNEHYKMTDDIELIERLYAPLVEKAALFMVSYRDKKTGLPDCSYDLWEEKRGISTYTASSVYAALVAAAELSRVVGKTEKEQLYRRHAEEIRSSILAHLWDERSGTFIKLIRADGSIDATLDVSSAYGIFSFGVLPVDDARLTRAWEATAKRLSFGIECGGLARYEGDEYYRNNKDAAGNPWILTTLWYSEYLTARAQNESDLSRVPEIFAWTAKHATPAGVLPEQLDPKTGAGLSATPLTWSHAGYILATLTYLERRKALGLQ